MSKKLTDKGVKLLDELVNNKNRRLDYIDRESDYRGLTYFIPVDSITEVIKNNFSEEVQDD